jgi:hypothetical protein
MTTTIALETDKGNFEMAIALGCVLLATCLAVTLALRHPKSRPGGSRHYLMGLRLEIAHLSKT